MKPLKLQINKKNIVFYHVSIGKVIDILQNYYKSELHTFNYHPNVHACAYYMQPTNLHLLDCC